MAVNAKHAMSLSSERMAEPIIVMHVGKNKGIIQMHDEMGTSHVIADGNHRIARAFLDQRSQPLELLLFTQAQTSKYKI